MCEWKSKYLPDYKCGEPPLPDDPKGYCILHSENEAKDIKAFKEKVEERIATTGDRIDLKGCYFPSGFEAGFLRERRFEKPVDFSEATFFEVADFSEVKFIKDAIFDGANFRKEVHFFKTEFHGGAYFLEAAFSQGAEFGPGVLFKGYAKFEEVTFGGIADFWGTFKQDVKFFKVSFQKAHFSGTDFCGMVEFSESHFEGDADFTGVIFKETSEKAEFKDIVFQKEVNFSSTYCLKTEIDFTGTIFKGRTFFMPRLPSGPTQDIEFGSVVFNTVSFLGQVIFQEVDLSHCSFLDSNIDKVDFRYCKFAEVKGRKNVLRDELDADEAVGAGLKPAPTVDEPDGDEDVEKNLSETDTRFFASLRMTKDEEKLREDGYEPVRRLYLELKRNFEDKKDWNTAGDFHYGEMECRRKGRLGGWLDFLLVTTYYGASGYGERPLRALSGWFFFTLLFFPLLYRLSEHDPLSACVWDSVRVATFMKIGIPIEPESWGRIVLTLQYFICPTLLALFALALRRKVKR